MILLKCPSHGLLLPDARFVRAASLKEEEQWQCPQCELVCQAFDVPRQAVKETICQGCKKELFWKDHRLPVTVLYVEQHVGFFCNPFCLSDYRERLKTAFQRMERRSSAKPKGS